MFVSDEKVRANYLVCLSWAGVVLDLMHRWKVSVFLLAGPLLLNHGSTFCNPQNVTLLLDVDIKLLAQDFKICSKVVCQESEEKCLACDQPTFVV